MTPSIYQSIHILGLQAVIQHICEAVWPSSACLAPSQKNKNVAIHKGSVEHNHFRIVLRFNCFHSTDFRGFYMILLISLVLLVLPLPKEAVIQPFMLFFEGLHPKSANLQLPPARHSPRPLQGRGAPGQRGGSWQFGPVQPSPEKGCHVSPFGFRRFNGLEPPLHAHCPS